MDAEALLVRIADEDRWEDRSGDWWLIDPALDVRRMTVVMLESGARLVTLTALPAEKQETGTAEGVGHRLYYHWDLGGRLLTLGTSVTGMVSSIVDLFPGADWVEREIHDYFGIQFVGRGPLTPLVTREGDPPVFGGSARAGGQANGSEQRGPR